MPGIACLWGAIQVASAPRLNNWNGRMKSKPRPRPDESVDLLPTEAKTLSAASIELSAEMRNNALVPHEHFRDAFESALDHIQKNYIQLFGKEAAKEAFARRASAISEGAPDPGMAAREIAKPIPLPKLSDTELAAFRAHAAANPWDKKLSLPSEHIKIEFALWLGRGLKRVHISKLPETTLGSAYAKEIQRNPERRVEGLIENDRSLPPSAPRSTSNRVIADISEDEKRERRRRGAERQQRYLLRKSQNG